MSNNSNIYLLIDQQLFYRLAKGRDVWESAMLQNANTKCNAILPIWGPEVCISISNLYNSLYYFNYIVVGS